MISVSIVGSSEISAWFVAEGLTVDSSERGIGYESDIRGLPKRFLGDRLGRFRRSLRWGVIGRTAGAGMNIDMNEERCVSAKKSAQLTKL